MDALLRYLLYNIIFKVLIFELLIMVICLLAIIFVKVFSKRKAVKKERLHNELSELFQHFLLGNQPVSSLKIPSHLTGFENLLETIEKFENRYDDPRWHEIKNHTVDLYLLPQAQAYAGSYSWYKKQLAARSYLLRPEKAPEKTLRKLLEDKNYLVRIPALFCVTKTHYKKLFHEMVQQMSRENKLSQFTYRDALIQADQEKFEWLESILASEDDPEIVEICLDVLSTRFNKNLLNLAPPFLTSKHRNCRIKALEAIGSIPDEKAIALLMNYLDDSDSKIRETAIAGLEKLYVNKAIPQISPLLNDSAWEVRLQAAKTLKHFGWEGMALLNAQKKETSPRAYEIAQFVLSYPE